MSLKNTLTALAAQIWLATRENDPTGMNFSRHWTLEPDKPQFKNHTCTPYIRKDRCILLPDDPMLKIKLGEFRVDSNGVWLSTYLIDGKIAFELTGPNGSELLSPNAVAFLNLPVNPEDIHTEDIKKWHGRIGYSQSYGFTEPFTGEVPKDIKDIMSKNRDMHLYPITLTEMEYAQNNQFDDDLTLSVGGAIILRGTDET